MVLPAYTEEKFRTWSPSLYHPAPLSPIWFWCVPKLMLEGVKIAPIVTLLSVSFLASINLFGATCHSSAQDVF